MTYNVFSGTLNPTHSLITMAEARSSSRMVTKYQGEGTMLGFSSSLTMHCSNAFGANNVVQQKGSFRRRRGLMGVHSAGEV